MHKYIVRFAGWIKKWLEHYLSSENEKQSRKILKLLDKKRRENQAEAQAECPHLAGSLGEIADYFGRTSIVWHGLNTGEIVGLCSICSRSFFPSDPDYDVWRNRASFNRISTAGITLSAWGKKAEPYLLRDTGPDARINMPPPFLRYKEIQEAPDPWLLNPDGSPDPFFANVDFRVAEAETDVREESREKVSEKEVSDGQSTE